MKTQDGRLRPAELIYSESSADIALVRLLIPAPELKHANLGDSDQLAVGQATYVIGAPYGFENSFSAGHIRICKTKCCCLAMTIKTSIRMIEAKS